MTLAKFTRKELATMRNTWREVEHVLERRGHDPDPRHPDNRDPDRSLHALGARPFPRL